MAVLESERKAIRAERDQQSRYFGKRDSIKRERVLNETLRLLREPGATEETVYPVICERFGVTPKYIENRFLKRADVASMASLKLNEAQILKQVSSQVQFAQEACEHIDEQLDRMIDADVSASFAIEISEVDGRAGKTVTTKKLPRDVAIQRLMADKIKYMSDTLRGMQSLMPQSVVNQIFDNRRGIDDLDDKQLDRELEIAQEINDRA